MEYNGEYYPPLENGLVYCLFIDKDKETIGVTHIGGIYDAYEASKALARGQKVVIWPDDRDYVLSESKHIALKAVQDNERLLVVNSWSQFWVYVIATISNLSLYVFYIKTAENTLISILLVVLMNVFFVYQINHLNKTKQQLMRGK